MSENNQYLEKYKTQKNAFGFLSYIDSLSTYQ